MRVMSEAEARPLLAQYRPLRSDVVMDIAGPVGAKPPVGRVATATAAAAESRWYIAASSAISQGKDAAPCSQFVGSLTGGFACTFKEKSSAFGLFGGYRFNRNFAAEAGYLVAGKFTAEASNASGTVSDEFTAQGIVGDVVASVPITGNLGLLARAGVFRWSVKDTFVLNGNSASASKSGISLHLGAGISLELNRNVELRGTYEKLKNVGDVNVTGRSDIDLLVGSLVYRFR